MRLYNTLTKRVEDFTPQDPKEVRVYTCGPTVYDYAHIGNLRTYVFEDLLKRSLNFLGYKTKHAMNITDVGHLVGDGDEGEDKMEKGAKREGRHPLLIAREYETQFFEDLKSLNILPPDLVKRATETIAEQIGLIKILEQQGFTYTDEFAVYFDTSKLSDYGKLSGQKQEEKKVGAREEVVVDIKKKNPQDFVLWFFTKGKYEHHILKWESPWGEGFPGWHLECSAISRMLLDQPFDIHCGGVDHIGTHHTNEIAQSEAAYNCALANYWLHGEFLLINSGRMGKSEGNAYNLQTVLGKGFSALDYRYFLLQGHYRSQLNFTWESLEAAKTALRRLYASIDDLLLKPNEVAKDAAVYEEKFKQALEEDLNIPQALATVWELLSSKEVGAKAKLGFLQKADQVLGLDLLKERSFQVPASVQALLDERQKARQEKDFLKSDELREKIQVLGFEVKDTPEGQKVHKV